MKLSLNRYIIIIKYYYIKEGVIITADMHTHSEFSHDSVCKTEDMCLSEIQKGTSVMAVTDHCDVFAFDTYDVYTPIKNSCMEAKRLNEKFGDKLRVLSGVEVGEGFWFPKECRKIETLCDYDVILGSVHCVKYKDMTMAYSRINFSELDKETVADYYKTYLSDIMTMINNADFDILTHMTCPINYIKGKFKIDLDLRQYEEDFSKILSEIIKREKSLEVNTAAFKVLGAFMPDEWLIKMYYDMGGRLITIGSDAHIAENASNNFETAKKVLKEIGFKKLYYYEKRKPIAYDI